MDLTTSKRMIAIKKHATENKDTEPAWQEVLELDDKAIYQVIKRTKSPEGAVKMMAKHLGVWTEPKIDFTTSKRVIAVKNFATENAEKEERWNDLLAMSDEEIFEIIRKSRTPDTAIKAAAKHFGIQLGEPKPKRARTSKQIRKNTEKMEGPQPHPSICATCLQEMTTLDDLQNHECFGREVEVEVDLSQQTETEPSEEDLKEVADELLEEYGAAVEEKEAFDADAPNGYFKNGRPKPVSKELRAQLIAEGKLSA